ncbi:MAG: hypothetical protein MUF83_01295 [Acidimicrobiales bacterium]|jgi:hypothetical protein|nr:hypothetical protein [Acidimicrobiales bacterium]
MRQRRRTDRVVVLALAVLCLLAASACRIVETPTHGFHFIPDNPNGVRILVIGDSLVRQPGPAFAGKLLGAGYETLLEPVNTAGLISGPADWQVWAPELIRSFRPTHVIIQFQGNFSPPYWAGYAPPGQPGSPEYEGWIAAQYGSPDWISRYVTAARQLTGLFAAAGVRTYWVQPPVMPPAYGNPSVTDQVWSAIRVALAVSYPTTRFLTGPRAHISTSSGGWLEYKGICGNVYQIRSTAWDGGVHFTSDGAGTYGRALARDLSAAEGWAPPPPHCPGLPD